MKDRRCIIDCEYCYQTVLGEYACVLGNQWSCKTDGTVCGDYSQREELHDWY